MKLLPRNLVSRVAEINGEPGVVTCFNGKPFSALTLAASEGRICAIYVVSNPEKLSHLAELPSNFSPQRL
jgi:RNA polymerase sigma-70 factor (ECF subfamily)